jgi:hypothetical protein
MVNLSFLKKVTNQEYHAGYMALSSVMEGREITADYVRDALDNVLAHKNVLVNMKNMKLRHPLTHQIKVMKHNRADYLLSLKGMIKAGLKSPIESVRNACYVLNAWLYGYRDYFSKPTIHEHTAMVEQITDDVKNNINIKEAMLAAELMGTIEHIELINTDIQAAYLMRSKEIAAMSRKATAVRSDAYVDLTHLINSMELAISLGHADSDMYKEALKEMADISSRFKAKYLIRITRSRNAALEDTSDEDTSNEDVTDDDVLDDDALENESTENEMLDGDNVPAKAENGVTFGVMALNGMDLQGETTPKNESSNGAPAMNGSITTNGVATTNSDTKTADDATTTDDGATELATGNGAMDSVTEVSGVDADAATNEDSNQES